ncbi:hypothetical protein [Nostoc sp.]
MNQMLTAGVRWKIQTVINQLNTTQNQPTNSNSECVLLGEKATV